MKKLIIGILLAICCFTIALICFNDISFPFLGIGIIIIGICTYIFINRKH